MSIIFSTSFDYISDLSQLCVNGLTNQSSVGIGIYEDLHTCQGGSSYTPGRYDGNALHLRYGSSEGYVGFLNSKTIIVCVAFKTTSFNIDRLLACQFTTWAGATDLLYLKLTGGNTIDVYSKTSSVDIKLSIGDIILETNRWYWLCWEITIDKLSGASKLYIDGVLDHDVNGVNTAVTTDDELCNRLNFKYSIPFGFPDSRDFDDLIIMDTNGASFNSSPLDDTHIFTKYPIADELGNTWTPNTGGTNYTQINEHPKDDSTNLKTNIPNNADNWLVGSAGHINDLTASFPTSMIQSNYRGKKDNFGNKNVYIVMNGIIGTQVEMVDEYLRYPNFYKNNPVTGNPWDHIAGDPIIPGIKLIS